jgi:hypothetical protein
MLTAPSVATLATFSGRAAASYSAFATSALTQAALLFTLTTDLTAYPTDTDQLDLAVNAICEMADQIYLSQPYAAVAANPFASETIGSYSYSKATQAVAKAKSRQKTGLLWWDLAIELLSQADTSCVDSGSVSALDRDSVYTSDDGARAILGPADIDPIVYGEYVSAELNPRPAGV